MIAGILSSNPAEGMDTGLFVFVACCVDSGVCNSFNSFRGVLMGVFVSTCV